ncbi:MAG: RNA polymerase sigma factor [Patescibacteria group bacterium]
MNDHEENRIDTSDEDILALSIKSPSAFSVLVERYEDAFLRKACSIIRDDEEAKDIVQEAFTKIYLAAPRFTRVPGASFSSWGYKIVVNTALSRYRSLKRKGVTLSLDDEDVFAVIGKEAFTAPESRERADYIASILTRMPAHLARVLALSFIDDLPQRDVAEREGISVSAVKARIHRAKKEFRLAEQLLLEKM